jgi:ABC-type oligopeptide transport system substrate-binding subunit
MRRKLWLQLGLLLTGLGLLAAACGGGGGGTAQQGGGGTPTKGGTLRLSKSTDIDYVDPALAYFSDSWELEYITCSKLFNYPDAPAPAGTQVRPEVVNSYDVSGDGKTYTFKLKQTFRFQNNRPVDARSFVAAFNRDANPTMQSPATSYMHEIVGADAVIDGKAQTISGVTAPSQYTLRIRLTKPLPDFVSRLTMPFFCPILPSTPVNSKGVNKPPGSGPYYIASRQVNRQIIIKQNPYYKGDRPHNVEQIVWQIGPTLEACRLQVERDQIDYCVDGLPPASYRQVASKYGINKKNGQFYSNTLLGTRYFALNNARPSFDGNLQLRKAMNYAIDRPALVRAGGYLSGKPTDQILPPALTKNASIYPIQGPDLALAKKLASGHMPPGDKLVLYTANRGAAVVRAQVLQFNLKKLGIDVEVQQFARAVQHDKCGQRGEPFDVCDEGWIVDYADPVTFFQPLLNGANIHATNNDNVAYFDEPRWNREIEDAARLTGGQQRKDAFEKLDIGISKQAAPWASMSNINQNDLVSKSTGCYLFHPVFLFDWASACKK